jgi:DNA-directed RNA polymerase specialized sigma24 family protein
MSHNEDHFTDGQLIAWIRGSQEQRSKAINYLYIKRQLAQKALGVLGKEGKFPMRPEDLIQETFFVLIKNILELKFEGKSSLETYFIAVARNLHLSNERKWHKESLGVPVPEQPGEMPGLLPEPDCTELLHKLRLELGQPCADLLLDSVGGELTTEEQARKYGAETPDIFKKRKYRCMEKLRQLIEDKKLTNTLKDCLAQIVND